MILVDTRTGKAYIESQKAIAQKIGVHPVTISRWKKQGKYVESFNYWMLFFHVEKNCVNISL